MAKTNEFCDYLMDRLAPLGTPSYKFMFGGYGIYLDGLMMGIVSHDALWLRADEGNRADYEARGIQPFQPMGKNGPMGIMPYYPVPDDVFEDEDVFQDWVKKSNESAVRHAEAKATKGGKKKATTKKKS
jgi:DNA transformation protein